MNVLHALQLGNGNMLAEQNFREKVQYVVYFLSRDRQFEGMVVYVNAEENEEVRSVVVFVRALADPRVICGPVSLVLPTVRDLRFRGAPRISKKSLAKYHALRPFTYVVSTQQCCFAYRA